MSRSSFTGIGDGLEKSIWPFVCISQHARSCTMDFSHADPRVEASHLVRRHVEEFKYPLSVTYSSVGCRLAAGENHTP